jgi:hypothetical protein
MRYLHYDVFTDRRFEGNQLAVFYDARGLSSQQMQVITQEMNFQSAHSSCPRKCQAPMCACVSSRLAPNAQ